jgi:hypothetical protein
VARVAADSDFERRLPWDNSESGSSLESSFGSNSVYRSKFESGSIGFLVPVVVFVLNQFPDPYLDMVLETVPDLDLDTNPD